MRTVSLTLIAAAAIVAGCAAEIPMRPSMTEQQVTGNVAVIREAPKTRADVHALLGEPWLRSDAWRVEVFRANGRQRKVLLVFAPYPVPVPAPGDKLEAYTLVAYTETGAVEAVDAAFVDPGGIRKASSWNFELTAGDYTFAHFGEVYDALLVSQRRFFRDDVPPAATGCTVLIACAPDACFDRVQLDGGTRRELPLVELLIRPDDAGGAPAGEASAAGTADAAKDAAAPAPASGVPGLNVSRVIAPLAVRAGTHQLRFTSGGLQGELRTTLRCEAPGLLFAVEHATTVKTLSLSEQLFAGFKMFVAEGTVEVRPDLPGGLSEQRVILNVGGDWLVPAGARN